MSDLLDKAVLLNEGRRRDAIIRLAETFGVNVETARRWHRQTPPRSILVALDALVENRTLRAKIAQINAITSGE